MGCMMELYEPGTKVKFRDRQGNNVEGVIFSVHATISIGNGGFRYVTYVIQATTTGGCYGEEVLETNIIEVV